MIQPPRRSVTRFFIPMIDVLTLLFCIFLLMPFVKSAGEGEESADAAPTTPQPELPPDDPKELMRRIDQYQKEIERLQKERSEIVEKLVIRALEIGKDDGKLYYQAGSERIEIRDENDATTLIANHKKDVRRLGGHELYYLFLYPRVPAAFPTEEQVTRYQRWFKGVAHGFDNPKAQE